MLSTVESEKNILAMNQSVWFRWVRRSLTTLTLGLWLCFSAAARPVPCAQTTKHQDVWLKQQVNLLVRAARAAYGDDSFRPRHDRVVSQIAATLKRCRLSSDSDFGKRYPEFVEYVRLLFLGLDGDHELGFETTDETYFAETSTYTTIPEFLLTPRFLKAVSRFENLPHAKALLREMNTTRPANAQLVFFSYESRHLGTPDNPDSFLRLLILVPGNAAQNIPEKWVQFGIADPRRPASVRNVSVVSVTPVPGQFNNVYFKDYFRTYRRNGSITVKGRWELGEGDDACVECHKSGVLPIFPVAGSVSREELPLVEVVNQRFRTYGPARFGKYLDATRLGPGLGSIRANHLFQNPSLAFSGNNASVTSCASCHHPGGLGSLNWPMDSTLIGSFVKGGRMPLGSEMKKPERVRFYQQLIDDYFSIDEAHPGILKEWLLGGMR